MRFVSFHLMPGWCAAVKVADVVDSVVTHKDFPSVQQMMEYAAEAYMASCITVSVNAEETKAIEWLKKNDFVEGPVVSHWRYGGRKTSLWYKDIPKELWEKYNGSDDDDEDDEDEEDDY